MCIELNEKLFILFLSEFHVYSKFFQTLREALKIREKLKSEKYNQYIDSSLMKSLKI